VVICSEAGFPYPGRSAPLVGQAADSILSSGIDAFAAYGNSHMFSFVVLRLHFVHLEPTPRSFPDPLSFTVASWILEPFKPPSTQLCLTNLHTHLSDWNLAAQRHHLLPFPPHTSGGLSVTVLTRQKRPVRNPRSANENLLSLQPHITAVLHRTKHLQERI
jgi:hypothetical protein